MPQKRAEHLYKGQSLQRELEHIKTTFIANGYPEGLVRRTLKKKKRRNDDLIKEGERVLCLPYIKGLSETLQRVCRPLEVRIRHKATNTLRSLLTRIKTPLPETQKTGVIYEIPCRCGQVYIGETCKTLIDRMKEHKRPVQKIDTNNSLAVHVKETLHDISWENAKVLQKEQHKIRRKIKEAILIQKTPCMNMDLGMNVDPIWKDILN